MKVAPNPLPGLAQYCQQFLGDPAPEGVHAAYAKAVEVLPLTTKRWMPESKAVFITWAIQGGPAGYWLAPEWIELGELGSPARDKAVARIARLLRCGGREIVAPMMATDADIRGIRLKVKVERRKHWVKDRPISWVVGYEAPLVLLSDD